MLGFQFLSPFASHSLFLILKRELLVAKKKTFDPASV